MLRNSKQPRPAETQRVEIKEFSPCLCASAVDEFNSFTASEASGRVFVFYLAQCEPEILHLREDFEAAILSAAKKRPVVQ